MNDISKGFEDVNKFVNNLRLKRKKTNSKKTNVIPLHSFTVTNFENNDDDEFKDLRL